MLYAPPCSLAARPCSLDALPCSLSAPLLRPLAPSLLPLKRPCSLSRSKKVIPNPKFGVYIYPYTNDKHHPLPTSPLIPSPSIWQILSPNQTYPVTTHSARHNFQPRILSLSKQLVVLLERSVPTPTVMPPSQLPLDVNI